MSGVSDQVPLFEGDEDIGHRAPRVKWFACVGVAVVGTLALVIAISVSYSMSPEIHNVTTIMPGPGITIQRSSKCNDNNMTMHESCHWIVFKCCVKISPT